jgi:hypothetical protein
MIMKIKSILTVLLLTVSLCAFAVAPSSAKKSQKQTSSQAAKPAKAAKRAAAKEVDSDVAGYSTVAGSRLTPLTAAEEKYMEYDFKGASDIIDRYIAKQKAAKQQVHWETTQMEWRAKQAQIMLGHVEKIAVIDSFVVDKDSFFQAYKISPETGTLSNVDVLPEEKPTNSTVVFTSANKGRMMWAMPDTNGKLRITETNKLTDGSWDKYVQAGNILGEGDQNYPFMMPDGTTLYYASNGPTSLGGYDIFISRKDPDTGEYLQPQNMGFPYNSPADDYLLVIDENTGVGWWATDRNQIVGKLTIYVFVTNETRQNYDAADPNIIDLASLTSIKMTQTPGVDYSAKLEQIENIGKKPEPKKNEFEFNVKNGVVYYNMSDVKTDEGKSLMTQWLTATKQQKSDERTLKALRKEFSVAGDTDKASLQNEITTTENAVESRRAEIDRLANAIRQAELNN